MARSGQPRHKKIRLEEHLYRESGRIVSVTICTNGRKPFFTHSVLAEACVKILLKYVTQHALPLLAYCLMPDHLHILMGPTEEKGIVDIVRDLKSKVALWARSNGFQVALWQASFYDHFVRREESLQSVALYILNNPVRKGLVDQWEDYPYSGSPFLA